MEREVGGAIGMENTCKPMAVSFQCMTKSTTKKKKKRCMGVRCSRLSTSVVDLKVFEIKNCNYQNLVTIYNRK